MKLRPWKTLLPMAIATTLLVSSLGVSWWSQNKSDGVQTLEAGAGTCFNRVGQTFTAFMIRQFNSFYLTDDFVKTTNQCFDFLNDQYDAMLAGTNAQLAATVKKITSDVAWFHERIFRVKDRTALDAGEIEITLGSNVVSNYSDLEIQLENFQQELAKVSSSYAKWKNFAWGTAGISLLGIIWALVTLVRSDRKIEALRQRIEQEASETLLIFNDFDQFAIKTNRLLERYLKESKMFNAFELYEKLQMELLERQYSAQIRESAANEPSPTAHAATSLNRVVKKMIEVKAAKFQANGVHVQEELEENFWVANAKKDVEGLVNDFLDMIVQACSSAEDKRKIVLKGRTLGGTAYLKCLVYNTQIDERQNPKLKKFIDDAKKMQVAVAIRHKLADEGIAEMELVFHRFEEKRQTRTNVIKGSKKELLERMKSLEV